MEDMEEFNKQVKDIEVDADKIIAEATKKRDEILNKARTNAASLYEKKLKQIENDVEQLTNQEKAKIRSQRVKIIKQGEIDMARKQDMARKKIPRAVEYLIEQLDLKIKGLKNA